METSLYEPVKRFLEQLGYTVKGEVRHCDPAPLAGAEHDEDCAGDAR